MRFLGNVLSGVGKVRPIGLGLRTWIVAALVAALTISLPVYAVEGQKDSESGGDAASLGILTLADALEHAARNHPAVWEASAGALQTELAWERQQAQRRLQASVTTDVAGVVLDSGTDDGINFSGGLTLDRPVSVTGSWQLATGSSLSFSGQVGGDRGPGSVLSLAYNRQLWPSPELSGAERERLSAEEALDEIPIRVRRAYASALIDVFRRYRAYQISEARVGLLASQAAGMEQRYAEVVAQFDRGLVSEDDVIQAEMERDRAQAQLERAERELALTRRSFLRDLKLDELGEYRLEPLPTNLASAPVAVDRAEAAARALSASVDFLVAQRNLRSAERRHEAAMKAPKLSASLSVRTSLDEWDSAPVYSAFVVASYDLADGGSLEIERRDAELNLERARRGLESARAGITQEVDRLLSDLEWLAEQVRLAERSLKLAERTLEVRIEQGRRGVVTERTVEESRRAAEEARLSYIEAVVEYESTRFELTSLMGEELEIEAFLGYPSP